MHACSVYLSVEVTVVLVEVPDIAVVTVGQTESLDPVIPSFVSSPSGDHARNQCRWTDIKLKPLIVWKKHKQFLLNYLQVNRQLN